jgi:predicted small secreted protein
VLLKANIKERLVVIMKGKGKSRINTLLSMAVLIAVIGCAVLLSACDNAANQDNAGEDQSGGTAELEENIPIDNGDTEDNITIKFEGKDGFPKQYKEQFSNNIAELFTEKYSPYYQVLGFEFTNVEHALTDIDIEVTFFLKMIVQNYYRDPDTVEYIKEAKESGSKHYRPLYDEYNQPKESNYDLKFTAKVKDGVLDMGSAQIYTNVHPKGVEYVPIGEDFFPEKNE